MPDRLLRPLRALVGLGLLVALAGCGGPAASSGGDTGDFAGTVLDPPFTVDGTPLVDTDGAPFSLREDTDAPLTLVFFGYTHCPDICGQVMSTITLALTRLSEPDRSRVAMVFVTTDPARDDERAVADYVHRFDDSFVGLTGDLADIEKVAAPLGVGLSQEDKLPDGGYDVTHGTQILGIDAGDEAPVFWGQDVSQVALADDIHTLLGGEA